MADRFQLLTNGDVYDTQLRQIVKRANGDKPQTEVKGNVGKREGRGRPPKEKKPTKAEKEEKQNVAKAHTQIALEILDLNKARPINKADPKQLYDRAYWYFERCAEEGVTPIPQGLVNAWGFKAYEENLLLSGNSGLSAECRDVISTFKQALEQVAEGSLVDGTTSVVGKIFDLKNRFGWSDQGNLQVESKSNVGEIASKEELQKALAQMPMLDAVDEMKIVDVDFEVME